MRTAIYPGSFNPWHRGHEDVVDKALCVFDHIIVAKGKNLTKEDNEVKTFIDDSFYYDRRFKITVIQFEGLLVDFINEYNKNQMNIDAVIRGLRNGHDLQYEMNLQYNNEDLGIKIPVVYFVTDRTLSHISSSSIREIEKFRK